VDTIHEVPTPSADRVGNDLWETSLDSDEFEAGEGPNSKDGDSQDKRNNSSLIPTYRTHSIISANAAMRR
jgi:hypothetical protein